MWGAGNSEERVRLAEILNTQLRNYPDAIEKIESLRKIAQKLRPGKKVSGYARQLINKWIAEFLKIKYDPKLALKMYEEIWTSRSNVFKRLKFNELKHFVEGKGGRLITTEEEFNKMKEAPTLRMVKIAHKAEDGIHSFYMRVNNFYYLTQWCPQCIQFKCEKAMRKFMEEIFGGPFPKITLKNAYGISKAKGGSLEFDGYNARIIVNGISFTIAFEFDGLQHDIFPNFFHKTLAEFRLQEWRDTKKNLRASQYPKKTRGTILIRIKEKDGFNKNELNKIPAEITKQFKAATGIKLRIKGKLIYDIQSGKIKRLLR